MADTVQIPMPQMGESVSEGTILTWHKQEGDWVDKDETIVEVSTDKVDAEVPAPQAGKLVKILAQEDETVEVGQALAELEPGEAPAGDGAAPKKEPSTVTAEGNGDQPAAAAAPTATATPPASADTPSTPVARRVAAVHGIDLEQVSGSGTGGKVVKEDVLAHIDRNGGDGATATRPRPAAAEPKLTPIRGRRRGTRPLHEGEPRDPDRDELPHARGRHARPPPAPAQRGAEGGAARHEGVVHPPDRPRDRDRGPRPPGDGPLLRRGRRQAAADRARVRQPRARRRRAAQGRRAHADRACHQGRRRHGLRHIPRGVRGPDPQDARRVAVARRPAGREHHAHEPGRHRDSRLGAAADAGPGHDRRDRARSRCRRDCATSTSRASPSWACRR